MDEPRQVALRFGRDFVVRYLSVIPARGDSFMHDQKVWVVTSVAENDIGLVVTLAPEEARLDEARSG